MGLLITGGAGGLITGVWWASKITSKVEAIEASIANALGQPRTPGPRSEMLDPITPPAPKSAAK